MTGLGTIMANAAEYGRRKALAQSEPFIEDLLGRIRSLAADEPWCGEMYGDMYELQCHWCGVWKEAVDSGHEDHDAACVWVHAKRLLEEMS